MAGSRGAIGIGVVPVRSVRTSSESVQTAAARWVKSCSANLRESRAVDRAVEPIGLPRSIQSRLQNEAEQAR
jgi:hypothetical protein